MQVVLIIGQRGEGKSTITEQRIHSARIAHQQNSGFLWAYDIERRYYKGINSPVIDQNGNLIDVKVFAKKASELQNSTIVYEEASVFFHNRGHSEKLKMTLVQSRYQGNVAYLIYHSICAVPYYVYELTDCIILLRTKDSEDRVLKKYKELYPAWKLLKQKPEQCKQFKLLNGKYSPYLIITL